MTSCRVSVRRLKLNQLLLWVGIAGTFSLGATAAHGNVNLSRQTLEARVEAVRQNLWASSSGGQPSMSDIKLAQWMNWGNWPNWNNWPNWQNWGNWFNR